MKIGIVGLPNVGKTTLFNALTHAGAAATAYAYTSADANVGVVPVPDPRLWRLNEVLQTPRAVPATIDVVDIPGLAENASHGEGLGNAFLAAIRAVDAIVHVVRAFEDPDVAAVHEGIDPMSDVELVETELVLSDFDIVERRAAKSAKSARSGDRLAQREMSVMEPLLEALRAGKLSRFLPRDKDDEQIYRELALVTERPVLFVLNVADEAAGLPMEERLAPYADFVRWARERGDGVVAVAAKMEADLGELEPEEAAEFRAELGATEGGMDELITAAYKVLGYITFFTGDFKSSESRAWQLAAGSTARQAAGRIHSDIAARFVRAEVVPIVDLIALGSFHAAKEKGVLRVEGKEYIVKDGDVMNFRHTA
jgi:GTP-binding protein YchF